MNLSSSCEFISGPRSAFERLLRRRPFYLTFLSILDYQNCDIWISWNSYSLTILHGIFRKHYLNLVLVILYNFNFMRSECEEITVYWVNFWLNSSIIKSRLMVLKTTVSIIGKILLIWWWCVLIPKSVTIKFEIYFSHTL